MEFCRETFIWMKKNLANFNQISKKLTYLRYAIFFFFVCAADGDGGVRAGLGIVAVASNRCPALPWLSPIDDVRALFLYTFLVRLLGSSFTKKLGIEIDRDCNVKKPVIVDRVVCLS